MFDELIEVSDTVQMGTITNVDRGGWKEKCIADMTYRARVKIEPSERR